MHYNVDLGTKKSIIAKYTGSVLLLNLSSLSLYDPYLELAAYFSAHTPPWYGSPYDTYLELAKYFRAHTPWHGSPYERYLEFS